MAGGRPTKYSAAMLKKADHYCDNFAEYGHATPIAVGLAKILKVNRSTIYEWADKHPEFSDTLSRIETYREFELVNGGLLGSLNPTITKMMLAGFGHSDKPKEEQGDAQPMVFNFSVNSAVDDVTVTNARSK